MPKATKHPIEIFRARLVELRSYPPGVIPVPAYLPGTAFFSAAAGLVVDDPDVPLPPFPFGGVMFVGHNLDAETAFMRRLASGRAHGGVDRPMLTWRNLYRLLERASLAPRPASSPMPTSGSGPGTNRGEHSQVQPTRHSAPGAGASWKSR